MWFFEMIRQERLLTTSPHRKWQGLFPYLPSFILILVAVHQLYLAQTADLSPWKGGGFGMFSTTDGGPNRHLHIFLIAPEMEQEVWPSKSLEDMEDRVKELPTEAGLSKFAREIANRYKNRNNDLTAVRVEVWRTQFAAKTLQPFSLLLREFTLMMIDKETTES